MNNEEKNCYSCGYCREVIGSAHKQCNFDWLRAGMKSPECDLYGVKMGWYNFPVDFDPTWQKSHCPAWSETGDPEKTMESAFLNFIAFMTGAI